MSVLRGQGVGPPTVKVSFRPGVRKENISINKLCSMSGVTQSTVNNIVSGRNRSATISTIKKLCDGLGISIEDFFHSELFRGLEQELK